jgi:hypothetical protein
VSLNHQQEANMKAIKLNETANDKLDALSKKRKDEHSVVKTKQSIVEQLIEAAHKREVK